MADEIALGKSPPVDGEIEKVIMSNENRGRGMKEGWKKVPFEKCLKKISKQKQIKAKDYQETGRYPVVSQDSELICGYYNDESYLYSHEKPVVIFGDHTRNIKYVDFDFIIGADGTQILMPNDDFDSKYFYYSLRSIELRNLGYARHYKLLKERSVYCPPLSEQQSIVAHLDASFAEIDALKAKAAEEVANAKAMFDASLREEMTPKEGWEEMKMSDICSIKSKLVNPQEEKYQNLLHVGGANIVSKSGELIDLLTAKQEKLESGKFYFENDVVLYNKIRPYLKKVARPSFMGLCSADMYPLTPATQMSKDYLFYILISEDFTSYAISGSARAGMPKVNRDHLFAYQCKVPPISTQQRIVAKLDTLRSHLTELEQKYNLIAANCDALKQAILRETF